MSVPYALHAKTADRITDTIPETDPIFGASIATGITATDTTNWNNKLDSFTEADPIFGASIANGITVTDTTNWNNKLDSETDPIFGASIASGITATDTANWSNKLDRYTETDPVFGSSVAGGITGTDTSNWKNKLDSESDPIYSSSVAGGITGTDTTSWNNKLDSFTEADPIFGASVASGITGTDTTGWNNKQDQVTAGTGIDITNNVISTTSGSVLAIGDSYQGGIIFWLDATGQHGLIAATADQSTGIQWYNGTNTVTNAVRDGIGASKFNTERIIANQGAGAYAAQICANYQGGNYVDWYLPSIYELNLLYLQKTVVGGFAVNFYWSSSEVSHYYANNCDAWIQHFSNGSQDGYGKFSKHYVRAVRAF